MDTAGIRRALDEAESIGIQKSMEALADADLVLVVLDASQPATDEDEPLLAQVEQRAAIVVANKADLQSSCGSDTPFGFAQGKPVRPVSAKLRTSALTGEGIAELRAAILQHVRRIKPAPKPKVAYGSTPLSTEKHLIQPRPMKSRKLWRP